MTITPEQLAAARKMIEEALVEPGYLYIEHLGEYEGKEVFQLCYVVGEDGFVPKTGWPIYALFDLELSAHAPLVRVGLADI